MTTLLYTNRNLLVDVFINCIKNMLLPRIDCNYAFSRMLKEFTNCHPSFADMSHIRILKRVDSNIKLPCFCAGNKLYFDRIFMYFQITFVSCLLYNIINDYVYEIPITISYTFYNSYVIRDNLYMNPFQVNCKK